MNCAMMHTSAGQTTVNVGDAEPTGKFLMVVAAMGMNNVQAKTAKDGSLTTVELVRLSLMVLLVLQMKNASPFIANVENVAQVDKYLMVVAARAMINVQVNGALEAPLAPVAPVNQRRQLVTAAMKMMNVYLRIANAANADIMDKFLMVGDVMHIANVRVGCVRDGVYLIVVLVWQNILMALVVGKILTVSQTTAIVGNVELEEGFPMVADALIMTSAQVEGVLDGISLESVVLVKLKVLMVLAVVRILTANLPIAYVINVEV